MTTSPAISVIIPMFNAAKYVGECLESLLAQTFQDFEVIIVDDCSTDSSCAIVESYAPKFNGRLKLVHMEKNSGTCAMPRNEGLNFARGEYIYSIDADDLLTLTAFEELYTLAKDFDAEVVYCERHYKATHDLSDIYLEDAPKRSYVKTPTFDTEDFATRVNDIFGGRYVVMAWTKMVRRDFIVEHNLLFPPVVIGEDDIWTYGLLFNAKKFLRVPNVVYIWRQSEQSIMRKKRSPQETINFWLNPIVLGLKPFDEMLSKIEFFRLNPQYHCALLEFLVHSKLALLFDASLELQPTDIYEAIKREFGKYLGEQDVLVAWILTDLIVQQKIFVADRKRLDELEKKVRK